MQTIQLCEALPAQCQRKLLEFIEVFKSGKMLKIPGKTTRQLLLERVLEPHRSELEPLWDLDYLSWAICWTIQQKTGLDLCELER